MTKYFLIILLSLTYLAYGQILGATKYCEVNNAEIKHKANSLRKSTLLDTAKRIFSFVQVNIKYERYANTRKGAVKTLHDKMGNCADQAHLLVALFRAAGIPARYVHGTDHYWTQCQVNGKLYDCDPTHSHHSFGKRYPDGKKVKEYMNELSY